MPRTQKNLYPKNLRNYEVFVEDESTNSVYFNVSSVPQVLTGGKNSFLIDGSPYLKNGSKLLIEIVDSAGNNIYQAPVSKYTEGTSLMISIEVYPQTPSGFATIFIMGEATTTVDGSSIPDDWKNTYNVRWTKKVMVEPRLKNISPLRFSNPPKISLLEEKRFYSVKSSSFDTFYAPITTSITPFINNTRHTGYILKAEAPTTFSSDHVRGYITGSITINNVNGTVGLFIDEVLNSSTAITNNSLIRLNGSNPITSMLLYSGSYYTELQPNGSSYITSTTLLRYNKLNTSVENKIPISYARIKIFDLSTFSGNVAKIKLYNKVSDTNSDYKLIADVPIIPTELITSESIRGVINVGDFYNTQESINNWYADELVQNSSRVYPVSGSTSYYDSSIAFTTGNAVEFEVILEGVTTGITDRTFIKTEPRGVFTSSFTGGVTASNNNTFIKTGSRTGWNAQAYSIDGYNSNLFVSATPTWTASLNTQSAMFGITANPTLDASSSIDYAWYMSESGDLQVYKTGSYVTSAGKFTTSSILKIVYENNTIKYLKDNVQQYAESRAVSTNLYFDSSFYFTSSQGITNVKFGPLASWDSQVYALQGYTSSVFVSTKPTWQPTSATQSVLFGLSTTPTSSTSTSSIDFGWYLAPTGELEAYKYGSYVTSSGTYNTESRLRIQCDGDTIKYIKNDVIKHTETRNNSAELRFDSTFLYGTSEGITDVKYGLTSKEFFTIIPDEDTLISSIYADVPVNDSTNKFSGSAATYGYFIGNREPILVSRNTEYTLSFNAFYKKEMNSVSLVGNTPSLEVYIVGVSGSKLIVDNPLGQIIGRITPQSDIGNFINSTFNFTPLFENVGNIGIRFIVKNGYWNFSNISLKPAYDGLTSPDEMEIVIPNTEHYNSLLQYKAEFFDINNNSTNIVAISTPTFFTGSNIDLGILP